MIAVSAQPTLAKGLVQSMITAFGTVPGAALILTPHVHLYTANSGLINKDIVISQFTEATFPGYAAATVTLAGPQNFLNSLGIGNSGRVNFTASSAITTPGQSVLGYWIDNGTSTIYMAEQFSAPITFVNPYDFLDLSVLVGAMYQLNITTSNF